MTNAQKTTMIQNLLGETLTTTEAETYLTAAGNEILAWRYGGSGDTAPTEVPAEYEMTQVFAVVAGYSHSGAEGQTYHAENGITRTFQHADMLAYIRGNVVAKCGVPQ